MKHISRIILWAWLPLTLALAPVSSHAQAIATVDLKKLFDNYWKTKQADANLKERASELDKKRKDMLDDARKLQDDYNKLLETANDQAVSSDEREKRKKSAEKKLLELREIETALGQFDRSARTQLGEQQRNMRDKIILEIREIITTKSKTVGYQMVIDSAAETVNGTPVLLFQNGQADITDDILKQLNATTPAGLAKPEDAKSPALGDKKDDKK